MNTLKNFAFVILSLFVLNIFGESCDQECETGTSCFRGVCMTECQEVSDCAALSDQIQWACVDGFCLADCSESADMCSQVSETSAHFVCQEEVCVPKDEQNQEIDGQKEGTDGKEGGDGKEEVDGQEEGGDGKDGGEEQEEVDQGTLPLLSSCEDSSECAPGSVCKNEFCLQKCSKEVPCQVVDSLNYTCADYGICFPTCDTNEECHNITADFGAAKHDCWQNFCYLGQPSDANQTGEVKNQEPKDTNKAEEAKDTNRVEGEGNNIDSSSVNSTNDEEESGSQLLSTFTATVLCIFGLVLF